MVVPKFCCALLNGKSLTVYGDGQQTRDYVFVKDVVALKQKNQNVESSKPEKEDKKNVEIVV